MQFCEDFGLFERFLRGGPESLEAVWIPGRVFHFVLSKISLLLVQS